MWCRVYGMHAAFLLVPRVRWPFLALIPCAVRSGVSPALVRSISLGAADFLQKPITPSVLRSKLKELFQPTSLGPRIQNSVTVLCIDDQPVVRRTVVYVVPIWFVMCSYQRRVVVCSQQVPHQSGVCR
jgi:hypothetical protein